MIEVALQPEPRGAAYRALVEFVARHCACASVAVDPSEEVSLHHRDVLEALRPFSIDVRSATCWPGTDRGEQPAQLVRFALGPLALRVLASASEGLFDWRAPDLPQDLCAYRADGSVLLATVSRDRRAWLELTPEEARHLPPILAHAAG